MVTLADLFAPFDVAPPATRAVPAGELPPPYRELLDHTEHMTVTVERFHGSPVDVCILAAREARGVYSRQIVLKLQSTGQPVQFGLVEVTLAHLAPAVRADILAGRTPLGRVLIQHDVLRTVQPVGFLAVDLAPPLAGWLGMAPGRTTYGRLGVISAEGRPAIRVLEILAPVE